MVVATWAKGMCNACDTYEVARTLGYQSDSKDERRRLQNHYDEYLVRGGIATDEYRLLAVFDGHEGSVYQVKRAWAGGVEYGS